MMEILGTVRSASRRLCTRTSCTAPSAKRSAAWTGCTGEVRPPPEWRLPPKAPDHDRPGAFWLVPRQGSSLRHPLQELTRSITEDRRRRPTGPAPRPVGHWDQAPIAAVRACRCKPLVKAVGPSLTSTLPNVAVTEVRASRGPPPPSAGHRAIPWLQPSRQPPREVPSLRPADAAQRQTGRV